MNLDISSVSSRLACSGGSLLMRCLAPAMSLSLVGACSVQGLADAAGLALSQRSPLQICFSSGIDCMWEVCLL